MSKYKFVRCLLIVFLALMAGKALYVTFGEMSEHRRVSLQAYPSKSFDDLIAEHKEVITMLNTVGLLEDHAKALIKSDIWKGSVELYLSVNRLSSSGMAQRDCDVLQARLSGLSFAQNESTKLYMGKYPGGGHSDPKYVELMIQHRNWEHSINSQGSYSNQFYQAWALFVVSLFVCGMIIVATLLMEQGMLGAAAARTSAYITMSLFIFVGAGFAYAPAIYAQQLVPSKSKAEKKKKSSKANKAGEVTKEDDTYLKVRLNYFAIEALGSPQRNGGQVELAPEWVLGFGKVRGAGFSGFGFVEIRKDQSLNFVQQGLDISHPKWQGLKFVSSAGFSGRKSHASVGVGIALKKSPLKKFVPSMDFVDVNYFHGYGAAAKNEVQITYGSKPIYLTEKSRLVATGFYRARDWNSVGNNYGQLQAQFTHSDLKKVAFVYEAEIAGKSVTHLFGIKLFLR